LGYKGNKKADKMSFSKKLCQYSVAFDRFGNLTDGNLTVCNLTAGNSTVGNAEVDGSNAEVDEITYRHKSSALFCY
jgi:hypothetical protein